MKLPHSTVYPEIHAPTGESPTNFRIDTLSVTHFNIPSAMSISILESCKKRKRRPKLFGFQTFGDPGSPISPAGPFRENVRIFLQQCAEIEEYRIQEMPIWCTLLVHENRSFVVPLYTIEEDVKLSPKPYCDHCRCSDDGGFDLDDQTHLLHGLIHCNGFGHLICINGIEGGSKFLCGREVMDLWDRIWKVRCECGAGDDDGERMVACDICEIWQHTRCCGIDDTDNVPPLFVCAACCDSLGPLRI